MTPNTVQADGIYSDFGSDPCLQEWFFTDFRGWLLKRGCFGSLWG